MVEIFHLSSPMGEGLKVPNHQFWQLGQVAELCRRTSGPQGPGGPLSLPVSPMWSLNQGLEEPKTQPVSAAEKLRTLLAGRF